MRIIIGGALGRMGRELSLAAEGAGVQVACGVDLRYSGQASDYPIVTDFEAADAQADALIDFSRPDALPELLKLVTSRRLPAVLCATGYTDEELAMITEASKTVPILRSANMSLGINVMRQLAAMAARALGAGFDVEIVEKHHRMKADSPSGTALMLYEAIRAERGAGTDAVFGRYGRNAARREGEIGIHAVRGGTMTGEHEAGFYGDGEQLIITHRAENRSLFAQGALRGAGFLVGKPAGMYDMQDVVREMLVE